MAHVYRAVLGGPSAGLDRLVEDPRFVSLADLQAAVEGDLVDRLEAAVPKVHAYCAKQPKVRGALA